MAASSGKFGEEEEEKGPLNFLDRLREEERDTWLHFGDVRFWKHLEHIDTNQIYRTKSLEYKTMKMMFCEAIFYFLLLMSLTGYIVNSRHPALYESRRQQLDYWAGCKRIGGVRSCSIDSIKDIPSLFNWIRDDFTPKAFSTRDMYPSVARSPNIFRLSDVTVPWQPRYIGDTETSVLVGAIRMRQLRVQYNKNCAILPDYESIQPDCFSKFEERVQSKMSWAPEWTPDYLKPHYEFWTRNMTNQATMYGWHGIYPGDGFRLDLGYNITGANMRLTELEGWQWLDQRTRAFIVELNTLNPNVNIFVNSRMLFEFPASGGVIVSQEAFSFRALELSLSLMMGDDPTGVWGSLVVSCSLHLMLFFYVGFLIYKNGLRFFTYFWSIVDLVILILFTILVITNIIIFDQVSRMPNLRPEVVGDPEMFFPVGHLVPALKTTASTLSVLGLASWLKILKYCSLIKWFHAYVRVIERCIQNLCLFACLLFFVLFGFAIALHIAYGDEQELFGTLWGALVAVMVAPAGGVDFEPIFKYDDYLGPLLISAYLVVIVLLLLNTFRAICVDTYTVVTFQISEVERKGGRNPAMIFLWTYYNSLKGVKLVGKERDEDRGGPDEQSIALTSLPEAVAQRYMETKKKMDAIMASAEMEIDQQKIDRLKKMGAYDETTGEQITGYNRMRRSIARKSDAGGVLAIQDRSDNGSSPPDSPASSNRDNTRRRASRAQKAEDEDPDLSAITVNRVQLQRMLDDDEILRQICSTGRAVDVLRRFRVDQSGVDPYEAVAQLQANVAKKLDEIEEHGMHLSFDEMQTLRTVSQELHSALTESQKEWRAELLTVMQMASLLSQALVDLTRKLEQVQSNHNKLAQRTGPPR